jgi:hypothetical protein
MAIAVSIIEKNVVGRNRTNILSISMDAASSNVDTGLSKVYGYALGVVSMATAGPTMKRNIGSGATARNGFINVNSAAAGDVFILTVFGV